MFFKVNIRQHLIEDRKLNFSDGYEIILNKYNI